MPNQVIKINPLPEHTFSPYATVECIGIKVRAGGIVVGEIVNYEIVDRRLILSVRLTNPLDADEIDNFLLDGFD